MTPTDSVEIRLRAVEDELAIGRLLLAYGPAADARLASLAASRWLDDGVYDWDADGAPHEGRTGVEALLHSQHHLGLVKEGVAHFAGPPLIDLDGDRATALTYSLIMRREPDDERYFLWRVSAVRWDLERADDGWRVRRRTNRLLDETGVGSDLFRTALGTMYGELGR